MKRIHTRTIKCSRKALVASGRLPATLDGAREQTFRRKPPTRTHTHTHTHMPTHPHASTHAHPHAAQMRTRSPALIISVKVNCLIELFIDKSTPLAGSGRIRVPQSARRRHEHLSAQFIQHCVRRKLSSVSFTCTNKCTNTVMVPVYYVCVCVYIVE